MKEFLAELQNIDCECRFDAISQSIYSVDASIYEIKPLGIIIPRTREALVEAVKIVHKNGFTITPRGAATGITGACLGNGIVIDTSKYLNNILDINFHNKTAVIEPGVIQDQLNAALLPYGYRLGPDTSTGDRATIGGMAANNAAGSRSLLYGKMSDVVLEIELVLSDGDVLTFREESENSWKQKCTHQTREGNIYRTLNDIREQYAEEIKNKFPHIPRRVSGYNFDELIKPFPLNIAKILVGSEGTLGVFSKITVKIDPLPGNTGLCIIAFDNMQEAMQAVNPMLASHPIALEMIDSKIIESGRNAPGMRDKLDWLASTPEVLLIAELPIERLKQFAGLGNNQILMTDPRTIQHVWALRKAGLGLLLSKRSYSRAVAFIEDLSIPTENLPLFMDKFLHYLKEKNKTAGIYGHAGSGCLHIRPYMDFREKQDRVLAEEMMVDIAELIISLNGALSGEHGDGLVRSWLNEKMFGKELYQAFITLKKSFDAKNLMNPGKIVNGQSFAQNLRPAPINSPKTFFSFAKEGGLTLSADLCNGNGQCRKNTGVMCPSFQVTQDEYDTTRARANVFRDIFNKTLPNQNLASEELHNILDLCIQCKGCKTECPSQVDMAKMKAEALYHYQHAKGYSLRSRIFAHIANFYRWGSLSPGLFNFLSNLSFFKKIFGISDKRKLPKISSEPFITHTQAIEGKSVVLFIDTYSKYILPQVAKAAFDVLHFLGYNAITLPWQCCGRPLISKGFLENAKEKASSLIQLLLPYAEKNIPIIGLEPSCLLSFQDEYLDFFPHSHPISSQSILFDAFIEKHVHLLPAPKESLDIYIHTHCHQKALSNAKATLRVLKYFSNIRATEIGSGCCGMAGSFGYEAEHYSFSKEIAVLALLPAINNLPSNSIIVANGFSCRSQIEDFSERKVVHLAELLKEKFI